MSVALHLGDLAQAADLGSRIDMSRALPERRACLRIDTARALSLLAKDDEALEQLLAAERDVPQLVRRSPVVRETVRSMHRRAAPTARRSSALLGLARRSRAVA